MHARKLIAVTVTAGAILAAAACSTSVANNTTVTPTPPVTATGLGGGDVPASSGVAINGLSTVTFRITGSAPDGADGSTPFFAYGPDGTNLPAGVGLDKSMTADDKVSYYAVEAQLSSAGGSVTVEILIDGKVVSKGIAKGAFNIASAEISPALNGTWQSDT